MRLGDVTEKEVIKKSKALVKPILTKVDNADTILRKIRDQRGVAIRDIWISIALISTGLLITIGSYKLAEESGGSYYVWWGISLFGLYRLTRATYSYYDPLPDLSDGNRMHLHSLGVNLKKSRASSLTFLWVILAGFMSLSLVGILAEGVFESRSYSPMSDNEFKSQYVIEGKKNCIEGGGGSEYCRCAAEHVVENSTVEQLKQLDAEYVKDPEYISPTLNNAVDACIYLNE